MKTPILVSAIAAAAVAASPLLTIAPANAAPAVYASCKSMHRYFPHGVAKSSAVADAQVSAGYYRPASQTMAKKVFRANHGRLDFDLDGAVCEVRAPKPAPQPAPQHVASTPTQSSTSGTDPRFGTCSDANAHGYGNYVRGRDPEYYWYEDRDGDGIDCEF